jgi:hypothetical protein
MAGREVPERGWGSKTRGFLVPAAFQAPDIPATLIYPHPHLPFEADEPDAGFLKKDYVIFPAILIHWRPA